MDLFRLLGGFFVVMVGMTCLTSNARAQQPEAVPQAPASQPAEPTTQQRDQKRSDYLKQGVQATVEFYEKQAAAGAKFEARQLSSYAHYVLALDQDPAKAEAALKRLLALQDTNPKSPTCGEFAPAEGASIESVAGEGGAPGAVTEVTVLPLIQIVLNYGGKISPEMKQQLTDSLKLALPAIRGHRFQLDLSNVYIQQAVDILLIGELVRDPKAIGEGQSKLTDFVTIARSRGIEEYVTPQYFPALINALSVARLYTLQPEARKIIDPALKFVWAQVSANVVPRRGQLGGPHSRELDFVFGMGGIDAYLFLEGMRNVTPLLPPFSDGLRAYTNFVEGGWRPDDYVRALADGERIVRMRFGAGAGRDRYFYVTDDYAIGSASATASAYDRKLTFEFCAVQPLPAVWIVADPFDAPYGHVRNRAGQQLHPSHIVEQLAAVQERNVMLALMNLRAGVRGAAFPSVATDLVFPCECDDVLLNGAKIATGKPFEMNLKADSTLLIRKGPGALVVRFFDVDGVAGQQPVAQLKFDGNPYNVARLVYYQYRAQTNPPRPLAGDAPVRVGVMFLAERVKSAEEVAALLDRANKVFNGLQHATSGNVWSAKLVVDSNTTLEASLDLQSGAITRKVNGADFAPSVFKVNDRDLTTEILGF